MEIPQVEAFLAVGTFGGFRRAADALRITQPAVSARIRALEDSLNVRLFERGKHGLALSAAGQRDGAEDRKSTRLNSSHLVISYAVFCLKKKKYEAYTDELASGPSP